MVLPRLNNNVDLKVDIRCSTMIFPPGQTHIWGESVANDLQVDIRSVTSTGFVEARHAFDAVGT
eukprot:13854178-Heterocapsa_arctica.AAC.1